MIKIYKDGDHFAIFTDADTSSDFLHDLAELMNGMAEDDDTRFDLLFQLHGILPIAYDAARQLDGKAESSHLSYNITDKKISIKGKIFGFADFVRNGDVDLGDPCWIYNEDKGFESRFTTGCEHCPAYVMPSICDICGEMREDLSDYYCNICTDCKAKHTDIVLLKKIGSLTKYMEGK